MLRRIVLLVTVTALLAACSPERDVGAVIDKERIGRFYDAPDPLPGAKPGTLIRSERLLGAPAGTEAWRVLYLEDRLAERPVTNDCRYH